MLSWAEFSSEVDSIPNKQKTKRTKVFQKILLTNVIKETLSFLKHQHFWTENILK